MRYLGPTSNARLNEACAVVFLFAGLFLLVGLASYQPFDSSLNTVSSAAKPVNLTGQVGAYFADFLLQTWGLAAYSIPALILLLGWKWIQSAPIHAPLARMLGAAMMMASTCAMLGFAPHWHPIAGIVPAGGLVGLVLAATLVASMNVTGAVMFAVTCWIVGLYLISKFEMALLERWAARPLSKVHGISLRWHRWRERRALAAKARAEQRALKTTLKAHQAIAAAAAAAAGAEAASEIGVAGGESMWKKAALKRTAQGTSAAPPFGSAGTELVAEEDIPIRTLEYPAPEPLSEMSPEPESAAEAMRLRHGSIDRTAERNNADRYVRKQSTAFRLPPTELLNEPQGRSQFDSDELRDTAAQIKSKFEEFNVRGSVTQINPGPVVTTFEFKPEAGVKYSRITTLSEDLCLGLQAESILIERIPGKPTVGLEVPNSRREVISLRQILESEEFNASPSPLTVALGKDINGRIKVAALDSMPHLLIAGSTGSGKSVMLNSLIMSILYKATPQQVRMIMVDPKRLEFGLYEGVPHLLTPVITDSKKATNALRNAVLEMERRLKLLASQGVRNIDQYNRKVRQLEAQPRSLFEDEDSLDEPLEQIPYVMIVIDELADLMMLERANVEESVTRLAQMARAVGMHLVLATQRPSVDVITGLIKANFPSRISFRVATRVDSRTVLDVMGAEHLLGKGDMLFLPPGSSRLVRVHGSYVSEAETNAVVNFWKQQAEPEYDQTFLIAPPSDEELDAEEYEGPADPMYQEAVRVVCEMGKASTSTLQRRLRLGYGRAARILDLMQRDGIIGPPDGSRPREVLKRPDWLEEIENQLK
ncbi:MAG TPA: DNA translocase FtsK [Bryobacteraceae bacterium]|nr:DNA translocase FtsK [Bryobacteraceae bacterium]